MKEYCCGFLHVFLLRPLCAKMDGRGREGGEIAAAGRNSWTSDRLPDAMRVANIKRRVGAQTKLRIFQHFLIQSSKLHLYLDMYLIRRCTSVSNA